jgi:sarcosine/dimethylglycine N-methyltransferase
MTGDTRVPALTIADLYDRMSPAVEEAIVATAKAFTRTVPAPRADPFYGLDRHGGPSLRVLERMTAHGDFRKYVFVLDAGGGLGGVARWLALTYGCRVLVLDVLPRLLATARRLTERVRLHERVTAVAGSFAAIPVRDGVFTQIWSVEALQHAVDRRAACRELFRVLRPGSTLALQDVVRRSDAVPVIGGPWRHGTAREYVDLLAASGFATIECEDVTAERAETSAVVRSAAERFARTLRARSPEAATACERGEDDVRAIEAITAGPDYAVIQIFARRPSV